MTTLRSIGFQPVEALDAGDFVKVTEPGGSTRIRKVYGVRHMDASVVVSLKTRTHSFSRLTDVEVFVEQAS